jgi:hypothetical protein
MAERMVNFLAVLFFMVEGNHMHGKGRISRYAPNVSDKIELLICDACQEYGTDGVFSCDPLPLHWYFLPTATVERWYGDATGTGDTYGHDDDWACGADEE